MHIQQLRNHFHPVLVRRLQHLDRQHLRRAHNAVMQDLLQEQARSTAHKESHLK
jgi:hypothetical protein